MKMAILHYLMQLAVFFTELMAADFSSGIVQIGKDRDGVPLLCATESESSARMARSFIPNVRTWEAIPGIIRGDGAETFRLEVSFPRAMFSVKWNSSDFLSPDGSRSDILLDDGLGQDKVAGDFVYTSRPIRFAPNAPGSGYLFHNTDSPAGLSFYSLSVEIQEFQTSAIDRFVTEPQVGVLQSDIPNADYRQMSGNIRATPHLVNVQVSAPHAQPRMRIIGGDTQQICRQIYDALPDDFDFLIFLSPDHTEHIPRTTSRNSVSGLHNLIQVDYTGSRNAPYNDSKLFGSQNRLKGHVFLDSYSRGINSVNFMHELMHQWGCRFSANRLGISDDDSHYHFRTSAASVIGGFQWSPTEGGGFTLICSEGANGGTHASTIDKYMMGVLSSNSVTPIRRYAETSAPPLFRCDGLISPQEIVRTVTIQDIQALHGPRVPGPESAQRHYNLGFICESRGRFLTPTELTFYEILARHATQKFQPNEPAPYIGQNWVSINGYVGEGVEWRSHIAGALAARDFQIERAQMGVTLQALAFPNQRYTIQCSSDLSMWETCGEAVALGDGSIAYTLALRTENQFFRMVWNEL